MENLSPEIWAVTVQEHPDVERRCRHDHDAPEPPRPGQVLRAIGLVVAAHLVLVAAVLLLLQSFGIR
ncbi:hypothetical protein SAMN02745126_05296 [Enhydrobacter aerosaccus]|uniref:Uncharacterized protein n=1 Tax=Enhydrobacter aerosaccus TaxID=225324 RepID=A0A1T4SWP7_9HYPH|nr:hypothetical protein [Enhydrobacter aerosaccus]SKA32680.1 hypothetical protein SAMN02745126_05296 [Enhydrobacter aerosaccus]